MTAPIWNAAGELIAGLSVAGPVYRISKKKVGCLARWVMEYAEKISLSAGYRVKENR